MSDTSPPDAAGHRARLRKRLLRGGPDALQDYELVEYLLALVIRRQDTKPLAKRLLQEFGGLPQLFKAPAERLVKVEGMGENSAAAIRVVDAMALRMLKRQASAAPVLASWQALLDYLQADLAHHGTERVRVLHLDTKNRLLRDEEISQGTVNQAAVYVSRVVKRALELDAASLILVHNHPSGDPQPSRQDIALTRDIVAATAIHQIAVHDHVIIGTRGHASLRALGLM